MPRKYSDNARLSWESAMLALVRRLPIMAYNVLLCGVPLQTSIGARRIRHVRTSLRLGGVYREKMMDQSTSVLDLNMRSVSTLRIHK